MTEEVPVEQVPAEIARSNLSITLTSSYSIPDQVSRRECSCAQVIQTATKGQKTDLSHTFVYYQHSCCSATLSAVNLRQ